MREQTESQKLQVSVGNMREHQQLKVSHEMEREGTAKLKEHLKKSHGESGAEKIMRQRGYNPNILR
jgi:hypothetical protein